MRSWIALPLAIILAGAGAEVAASEAEYAARRSALVNVVEADVRATREYLGKAALDRRVIEALAATPRHAFVPDSQRRNAYKNRPLPIGHGQTISQPYIVAVMTDLLALEPGDVVFEVGTGSGYQAAVLAPLVARVYTMEIIEPLGIAARERLARLGYGNVEVRLGDGYYGLEAHAPYDAIIVTAAAGHVPPPLVAQLKPGGRMAIPVGGSFFRQQLVLITKDAAGSVTTRRVLPVAFVPLTGGH